MLQFECFLVRVNSFSHDNKADVVVHVLHHQIGVESTFRALL
jgi:hypothetical protein